MIDLLKAEYTNAVLQNLFSAGLTINTSWWDPKYGHMFGMWQDPLVMVALMGRMEYDRDV